MCRPPGKYLQEHFAEKPEAERLFLLTLYMRRLVESGDEELNRMAGFVR